MAERCAWVFERHYRCDGGGEGGGMFFDVFCRFIGVMSVFAGGRLGVYDFAWGVSRGV